MGSEELPKGTIMEHTFIRTFKEDDEIFFSIFVDCQRKAIVFQSTPRLWMLKHRTGIRKKEKIIAHKSHVLLTVINFLLSYTITVQNLKSLLFRTVKQWMISNSHQRRKYQLIRKTVVQINSHVGHFLISQV